MVLPADTELALTQDPRHALDDLSQLLPGAPDALQWREQQIIALAELALRGLDEVDLEDTLAFAAERLRVALDCDFTKIIDARSSASGLIVRSGSGWPDGVVGNAEVPEGTRSQAGYTIETGSPVLVRDNLTEQRFEPASLLVDLGIRSGVSVIISGELDAYGVLQADSRQPGRFEEGDVAVVQAYANVIGIIISQHDREQLSADFASIAAHELRTPLTLMIGHSHLLLKHIDQVGSIDTEHRDEIETLHVESLRLRRAVDTFLALGQIERRSVGPELADVDLASTIDSVLKAIRDQYPSADLRPDVPAGPQPWRTDEIAIHRIVSNLVENAVKYSPAGAPVEVTLEREGSDAVAIRVADRCGGLSAADLRELFRHRHRGASSGAGRGLGLGLYVSQRLAERVGGDLGAANVEGGCVFTLRLGGGEDGEPSPAAEGQPD